MQIGTVIGRATSTIKHPSFEGYRLTLVQLLGASRTPEGDPVLAIDTLQSGIGQTVILNLDGKAAREHVKNEKSPIRYFVIGLMDD